MSHVGRTTLCHPQDYCNNYKISHRFTQICTVFLLAIAKKREKCIGNLLLSDKNQNEYKKGPQSLNLCDGDFFFFSIYKPHRVEVNGFAFGVAFVLEKVLSDNNNLYQNSKKWHSSARLYAVFYRDGKRRRRRSGR